MKTIEFEEKFGSPYVQVHRGDLYQALLVKARETGATFCLSSKIVDYQLDEPSLMLENGDKIRSDLIIAADGE